MNVHVDKSKLSLNGKLLQYNSLLGYRYNCLCIKTNKQALIPIEVKVGKVDYPIEKVAQVAIIDDEHYLIAPSDQGLIIPICQAFAETLPQLKQEVVNAIDNPYTTEESRNEVQAMLNVYKEQTGEDIVLPENIILTTPEVNDDMKDMLEQSVDGLKKQCQVLYQKELTEVKVKLGEVLVNENPEELKKGNEILDKEHDKMWEDVENITNEILQAIAEANRRYHEREEEKERAKHNGLSEEEDKAVHSMKLGSYEE